VETTVTGVYRKHGDLDQLLGHVVLSQAAFDRSFPRPGDLLTLVQIDSTAGLEQALAAYPDAKLQTGDEFIANWTAWLDDVMNLFYVLLALSVIVSLFGMVNTLVLAVFERTRELGMLRAVGMTRRQARRMIRQESIITALIGAALGLPLGVGLAALVTQSLSKYGVSFSLPVGTLVVFTVVAVIAGVLAAIAPARRASRSERAERASVRITGSTVRVTRAPRDRPGNHRHHVPRPGRVAADARRGYQELRQHFPAPGLVSTTQTRSGRRWSTRRGRSGRRGCRRRDLDAIGITNQRETTLVWDRRSGAPIGRAIVWQDRRTAARCAELPVDLIRERTGLVPDPYFSATKLEWLLANVGAAGDLAFGTIDSWLIWKLCGEHATDVSNASRTMLLDISRLEWDDELLALFSVPREVLPRLVPSSGVVGEGELLGVRIPVGGIAGDQQAALFGQRCFTPGQAKVTYGTGAFVLVNAGSAPAAPRQASCARSPGSSATTIPSMRSRAPCSSQARRSSGSATGSA
jgi:hypothetical protein